MEGEALLLYESAVMPLASCLSEHKDIFRAKHLTLVKLAQSYLLCSAQQDSSPSPIPHIKELHGSLKKSASVERKLIPLYY